MAPKSDPCETIYKTVLRDENNNNKYVSSLGISYPTLRDHPLHTGYQWLKGKRADDGAEGLWRIHNNLYDLTGFIDKHPGGSDWVELTQGTDITEAFEAHHIYQRAHKMLPKFYVRQAKVKRNVPFTFKEDGFYITLRKKVVKTLKSIPEDPAKRSQFLTDSLLFGLLSTAVLATYFESFLLGAISGILVSLTGLAAHNFFHQRNNFRMYYFDFTMMHSREWRISHVLSHHLYPNTLLDLEVSSPEPFLQYLPQNKSLFSRYVTWFYLPIFLAVLFLMHHAKTMIQVIINRKGFKIEQLMPYFLLLLMYSLSGQTFKFSLLMFIWLEMIAGAHYGFVAFNSAHHHPDIFHDGDEPRPKEEMDWGLFQLDAVWDRIDITGSHFLVLTNFGDHTLHHLFPTIDHGKLEYLYPVFLETCVEFGIDFKLSSQLELIKGNIRQLTKDTPKREPPRPTKIFKK